MGWYLFLLAIIPVAGISLVGVYMLYSAVTGRGIPKPDPNSSWQIKVQFSLRGLIVFAVVGSITLFKLVVIFFEK